jgi:hypothetical protein
VVFETLCQLAPRAPDGERAGYPLGAGVAGVVGRGVIVAPAGCGAGVAARVAAAVAPTVPTTVGVALAGGRVGVTVGTGVMVGVGVAGALSVTIKGSESCSFWNSSTTRSRMR